MYQSLNEKETMFIYTIALKISIFVTLIKFLTNFWYLNDFIFDLIACSGFSSMFISSFSMLKQYKLSKF
jgi:presenilin-like A22 family membrane protease